MVDEISPVTELTVMADRVTVGATLAMATVWLAVLLVASSESLTWTETIELASPSGKVQTKLPPEAVVVVVPTWLPFAPQRTPACGCSGACRPTPTERACSKASASAGRRARSAPC